MKAKLLLVLCGLLIPLNLRAQNRIDVFAGYSFLGYYTYQAYTGPWTLNDYNGFEASAAFHLVPHLAAEADFSFENGPQKIQMYLGGPRVNIGYGKANFFAHGLFGGLRDATSAGGANTTFAAAFGGGVDYRFTRRIGLRLVQADYIRVNQSLGGYTANVSGHGNFRISTGVVFRF